MDNAYLSDFFNSGYYFPGSSVYIYDAEIKVIQRFHRSFEDALHLPNYHFSSVCCVTGALDLDRFQDLYLSISVAITLRANSTYYFCR